jgi:phosphatidate cytidylyltransferase
MNKQGIAGAACSESPFKINPYYHGFGGILLFVSGFLYASKTLGVFVFSVYLLYIVSVWISVLYKKKENPIAYIAYVLFGQCYIALPVTLLNLVVFRNFDIQTNQPDYHWSLILSLFIFLWVNDTAAYLVGICFGKHKLFERISPKKTWEGFWGGLFFTILSALVFAHFDKDMSIYHWLGLSVAVVVFGTFGDLTESLIKRTLNVKDAGKSLPGHGGFLDRFDSLLLAVYAVVLFCIFCLQY